MNDGRARSARTQTVDDQSSATPLPGRAYRCQVYVTRKADGFLAVAAALPGVAGFGATEADALADITEAFRQAIAEYTKDGDKIPWVVDPAGHGPDALLRWVFPDVPPRSGS